MIEGINHYNLRADEKTIEVLKEFYIEIVGLTLGHRPHLKMAVIGCMQIKKMCSI
jgi:hypothetical protein